MAAISIPDPWRRRRCRMRWNALRTSALAPMPRCCGSRSRPSNPATGGANFDDATRERVFPPADLVIMAVCQLNEVHLMLMSCIGLRPADQQARDRRELSLSDAWRRDATGQGWAVRSFCRPWRKWRLDRRFQPQPKRFRPATPCRQCLLGGDDAQRPANCLMPLPKGAPFWGVDCKRASGEWYGR